MDRLKIAKFRRDCTCAVVKTNVSLNGVLIGPTRNQCIKLMAKVLQDAGGSVSVVVGQGNKLLVVWNMHRCQNQKGSVNGLNGSPAILKCPTTKTQHVETKKKTIRWSKRTSQSIIWKPNALGSLQIAKRLGDLTCSHRRKYQLTLDFFAKDTPRYVKPRIGNVASGRPHGMFTV